ncbi:acyl-CoA thioesterase [Roseicyclus salinarum]|uniref:acyl-CoA thioesterase n=1 Tax=Roseicyclus salinarum TaxID=3036773 RepID=UPI00324280ED
MTRVLLGEGRKPRIGPFETHRLPLTCLPWDTDIFLEMNNGRVLTLFDLGRFGLAARTGLWQVLKDRGWGLVVAGASVRYRARIRPFQRFEIRTRMIGWDARFIYIEQAMWRGGTCCHHALMRTGVTTKGRLTDTGLVAEALGVDRASPPLPDWATEWTGADATRPWPPAI